MKTQTSFSARWPPERKRLSAEKSSPEQLIEAIREVNNGGSPMTSHIARKVVASFQQVTNPVHEYEKLSLREQEVMD